MVLRLIDQLTRTGVTAISICANGRTALYADRLSREPVQIDELHFSQDPLPRGPAGCLKDNEGFVGHDPFLIAHAACWLNDDAGSLVKRHLEQRNHLTVYCLPGTRTPGGVYVCDPCVLQHIPAVGYCDMKEQLIPRLLERGLRVGALPLARPAAEVLGLKSYLSLLVRVLHDQLEPELFRLPESYEQRAPGVWAATDATIGRDTRLFGPVVVGPHARVEEGAVLIGPAVIGAGAVIRRHAVLAECAVWPNAVVARGTSACRTVLTEVHAEPPGDSTSPAWAPSSFDAFMEHATYA